MTIPSNASVNASVISEHQTTGSQQGSASGTPSGRLQKIKDFFRAHTSNKGQQRDIIASRLCQEKMAPMAFNGLGSSIKRRLVALSMSNKIVDQLSTVHSLGSRFNRLNDLSKFKSDVAAGGDISNRPSNNKLKNFAWVSLVAGHLTRTENGCGIFGLNVTAKSADNQAYRLETSAIKTAFEFKNVTDKFITEQNNLIAEDSHHISINDLDEKTRERYNSAQQVLEDYNFRELADETLPDNSEQNFVERYQLYKAIANHRDY